jgi:reductive dehalogenase
MMPRRIDFEEKYKAKNAQLFEQKYEMFKRARWQVQFKEDAKRYYGLMTPKEKPGFRIEEYALRNASWFLEWEYARGIATNDYRLFSWDNKRNSINLLPEELKLDGRDPRYNTHLVKKAARLFGADLVGICKLDRRWIYTKGFKFVERTEYDICIPDEYQYVINIAVEMDYEAISCGPNGIGAAATGMGYSRMAFTAGLVAQFLRQLGYKAIPSGNDTAMNVPYAIQAGMGESGRHGILITERFGPRVRLCKVFTDLPLVCDEPIEFGVTEFCEQCGKCAEQCPSQAIPFGGRTTEPINECNAGGSLKWYVDGEKCFQFWARNRCDCVNCIRVCPFNKPKGILHSAVRWFIERTPQLNPLILKGDTLLGYDKRRAAEAYWRSC